MAALGINFKMRQQFILRVDLNKVGQLSIHLFQRCLLWTATAYFPYAFPDGTALLADFGISTTIPEGETYITELCGTKVGRPNLYR